MSPVLYALIGICMAEAGYRLAARSTPTNDVIFYVVCFATWPAIAAFLVCWLAIKGVER